MVAVLNTILLLIAVTFIIYETIGRLNHPVKINANSVIIVAATGIGVNAFTSWLFMKKQKHDLNIRSVFVHFIADALVSLGVVIAGIIIALTGIPWIDSLVSFAIIAIILYSTYDLLINTVNLSLDAVPENVNIEEVREFLENYSDVTNVHDLHIWALGTKVTALTVHLTTAVHTDVSFIISINHQLRERFSIEHTTIQVEFGGTVDRGKNNL